MATKTVTDPTEINNLLKNLPQDVVTELEGTYTELPDTFVTLPGGYLKFNGEVITQVEIRELNGVDEEIISKSPSVGHLLSTILKRGTVRIGDEPATAEILDALLSGDRDAILLGIRAATFGREVNLVTTCFSCQTEQEVSIDLFKDVRTVTLENQSERVFTVKCKAGPVVASLPLGVTQRKILDASDKSGAEINTILLQGCVSEINGNPVISVEQVRALSIRDRETITKEIAKRIPGPKLTEISKPCISCEEEMALPLSMVALFRY